MGREAILVSVYNEDEIERPVYSNTMSRIFISQRNVVASNREEVTYEAELSGSKITKGTCTFVK